MTANMQTAGGPGEQEHLHRSMEAALNAQTRARLTRMAGDRAEAIRILDEALAAAGLSDSSRRMLLREREHTAAGRYFEMSMQACGLQDAGVIAVFELAIQRAASPADALEAVCAALSAYGPAEPETLFGIQALWHVAATLGDDLLGQYAGEMFLAHYDFAAEVARVIPANQDFDLSRPPVAMISLAASFLDRSPAPCWARIVEEAFPLPADLGDAQRTYVETVLARHKAASGQPKTS